MLKGIVFAFIAAFAAADAAGGTVGNAFVEVSAERVKRLDGRDFRVFGNGVRISPNPGWRLVSPEFPRFDGNSPAIYRAVDFSGESEATGVVHIVTTETVDRHVEKPRLSLRVDGGGLYALPSGSASTNIVVSFTAETGSTGTHEEVVRIFEDGELLSETVRAYETDFDRWMWGEASGYEGSGASAGNVFTFACNLPPGDYTLAQSVSAVWTGCRGVECEDSAETNCNVSVRRLDLGCGEWIGLDRTGDPSAAYVSPAVVATARLLPEGTASGATWNYSGVCEKRSIEPWSLKLWTENRENASSAYLSERIEAEAGGVSSVTNFTVVKVDVTIDDVQSETKEEIDGAFVVYAPDEEDGTIGEEGMGRMVDVSFSCVPANLPPDEMVEISHSGPGELYEVHPGGILSRVDSSASYRASEIASKSFKLHGHAKSFVLKDGSIEITHRTSGAKDRGFYSIYGLESVTLLPAPENSNPQRKIVGVGERLLLQSFPTDASLSVSNGSILNLRGNASIYTAPSHGCSSDIEALFPFMKTARIVLSVIEPKGYKVVNVEDIPLSVGDAGAGMLIDIVMRPLHVNLQAVEFREVGLASADATGYFQQPLFDELLVHNPPDWRVVSLGNVIGTDRVFCGPCPEPWSQGSFSWVIPGRWKVSGDSDEKAMEWSDQFFAIETNGVVSIEKFNLKVIRSPANRHGHIVE